MWAVHALRKSLNKSNESSITASILINQQQEFYDHHTGQPALAGTSVKNWRILLQQSFIVHIHMPLMTVQKQLKLPRLLKYLSRVTYTRWRIQKAIGLQNATSLSLQQAGNAIGLPWKCLVRRRTRLVTHRAALMTLATIRAHGMTPSRLSAGQNLAVHQTMFS